MQGRRIAGELRNHPIALREQRIERPIRDLQRCFLRLGKTGALEPGWHADFAAYYEVLRRAQAAACDAVRPGVTCESIDATAREIIAEAGYGEHFIHRTGHGIGIETHEEPYIVAGNGEPMEAGFAFSVEPGIYLAGRHGARIEDIVVCTETGGERLNTTTRELVII